MNAAHMDEMSNAQKVSIGGEEYAKIMMSSRFGESPEYFVVKVSAKGKRTASRLNPKVHRVAISRIEAALQRQQTI